MVREATAALDRAGVPEPAASAEFLMAELLGIGRSAIPLYREPVGAEELTRYEGWVRRRQSREPVQRILGHAYFRNLKLKLSKGSLIPRPDTESVVEAVLERLDLREPPCRVLDLGTGSGAIAISVAEERPGCEVYASDISEAALAGARENAERAGVSVGLCLADISSSLEGLTGTVDLLVSNPPYIPTDQIRELAPEVQDWDPRTALDGGADGLWFYRRIFSETPPLLAEGADVVLEVGDGQAEAVLEMGRRAGFTPLGTYPDLAGTDRAALLRWSS